MEPRTSEDTVDVLAEGRGPRPRLPPTTLRRPGSKKNKAGLPEVFLGPALGTPGVGGFGPPPSTAVTATVGAESTGPQKAPAEGAAAAWR